MADELQFQVILDKSVGSEVQGVVAFGDFTSKDGSAYIYGHNDVVSFYSDLILGKPLPLVFVAKQVENLGTLVAIALFLHRDMAISPSTPGLLAAVTLFDGLGVAGLAHIDRDLAKFFKLLVKYYFSNPSKESLETVTTWIVNYRGSQFPSFPQDNDIPRIIDVGTDGFVYASVNHPELLDGWEELYRNGFLRGLLIHSLGNDRWAVLGSRKSPFLSFDLAKLAQALNQAEESMGEPPQWDSDGLWLRGPKEGTLILPSAILNLALRS